MVGSLLVDGFGIFGDHGDMTAPYVDDFGILGDHGDTTGPHEYIFHQHWSWDILDGTDSQSDIRFFVDVFVLKTPHEMQIPVWRSHFRS